MTIPTFNPPMMPSPGLRNKPQIKILRAEFGDGYTQHTRDGLNHIREMISLRWDVLSNDERDQIISFFKERGGDQPFYWTPPGYDEPIKFTCAEWSTTAVTPQYFSIDAEFRQEFLA